MYRPIVSGAAGMQFALKNSHRSVMVMVGFSSISLSVQSMGFSFLRGAARRGVPSALPVLYWRQKGCGFMLYDIVKDLIVSAITSTLIFFFNGVISKSSARPNISQHPSSRKWVHRQFCVCSLLFPVFLVAFVRIPCSLHPVWLALVKVLCLILAFFCFILFWGAFDAAFAFYPKDDIAQVPSHNTADHGGNDG